MGNGEAIEGTEVVSFASEYDMDLQDDSFGWFDLPVTCGCGPPTQKKPECIKGRMEPSVAKPECHSVMSGDDVVIGSICVDLAEDASHLEVTFQSKGEWALVTTEFWVGDNVTLSLIHI